MTMLITRRSWHPSLPMKQKSINRRENHKHVESLKYADAVRIIIAKRLTMPVPTFSMQK